MPRHWTLLHTALFAGGILILGMLAGWRASSPPPIAMTLPVSRALINGELAKKFETHYDAVFPAKSFGVSLWAAIELVLFGEGRAGVRVGEQGWLYTAEEFKTYADAQRQIALHRELILWVRDQLLQRDARLLVVLVPAKTRVYPEYLNGHRPARIHQDLLPRFHQEIQRAQILALNVLDVLRICKQQNAVFLRTDTHWTPYGAQCVAQAVGSVARGAQLAGLSAIQFRTRTLAAQPQRGDLFKFLPLDPYFSGLLPAPDSVAAQVTEAPARMDAATAASLLGDEALPRVTLVGTSYSVNPRWNFAGSLRETLGVDLLNYSSEGQGPFIPMLDYLRSAELRDARPRLVIWEIPERYLPMGEDLSAYALPAERWSTASTKEKQHEN